MPLDYESNSLLSMAQQQAMRSHNPVVRFLELARSRPVLAGAVRPAATAGRSILLYI